MKLINNTYAAVVAVVTIFFIVLLCSLFTFRGGQISNSRDGKFRIVVTEYSAGILDNNYYIKIVDVLSGDQVQCIAVSKNSGVAKSQLRGAERVVTWNESDGYADVSLPLSLKIRIYLPE